MARRVFVEILGDSSQLERTFKRSAKAAQDFNRNVSAAGRGTLAVAFQGLGRQVAFASGTFLGAAGLTNAIKSSVDAASDMNEQMSRTDQVFGTSADQVKEWSKTTTDAFGISQREAVTFASTFGALFAPIGITGRKAADLSEQLTELAADLAAASNTPLPDALEAIRSGLVGETEPLRIYGVRLSEARVQEEALRETGKRRASQLTEQEKTMARIKIIFDDSAVSQGNFAATSGNLAEQTKKLQAQIDNLQVTIGQKLVPALTNAVTGTNEFITALGGLEFSAKGADNWVHLFADHIGLLENVPNLGPLATAIDTVKDSLDDMDERARKALQTFHGLSSEDWARNLERRVVSPLRTRGPRAEPPAPPGPVPAGVPVALRNRWFDERLARQLDRLQDLGLRKQLAGLRRVAQEIRARIAITRDATRRLTLEDQLVDVYRQQRSIQEQITEQIKTQNQALKERAEAIKSAILERLQRRQTDVENRRALRDAQEQLRQAKILGGPLGIRQARETLADVRNRLLIAQLERRPAALRGGVFTLGAITINVHGVTDPEKVAQIVVNTIERKRRHGTTQTRGPYAGRH